MCGIVCAFNLKQPSEKLRPQLLAMSKNIRHRGPDWSGIFNNAKSIMTHERLAIVDPTSGKQTLFSEDKNLVLAANGEIYNHIELRKQFEGSYNFQTKSDCEVIISLYQKKGPSFLNELNGIFGFALYDVEKDEYFVARDHMGIIPLYMGWDENGTFYVASELKALEGVCTKIKLFPPGHYLHSSNGERIEKWVLRKAFEDVLPECVAWRQKEQFSDVVGYSWIDNLKEMVEKEVSDEQLAKAHYKFPIQPPTSKEEFYYRSIFTEHFPSDTVAWSLPQEPSVACSSKIALAWDESFKNMNDPSGRAIANVHDDAY